MISDCSSIRIQSTSCCFTSASDIGFPPLPMDLVSHLAAPQIPRADPGGLVDGIREPAFLGIQRSHACAALGCPELTKGYRPVLDPGVDLHVNSTEYRCLQRRSARHAPVRPHQRDVPAAQDGGEGYPPLPVADKHVRGAELLANVEHRHARRNKGRVV